MLLLRIFPTRMAEAAGLSLPTCALLFLSVAAAFCIQSLTGVWIRLSVSQWFGPLLMFVSAIYFGSRAYSRPRFSAAMAFSAVMIMLIPTTCALCYGVQSFNLPLRDDLFIGVDRAFGFDWMIFQSAMVEKIEIMEVLSWAYDTFLLQLGFTPVILAALGEVRRSDRFIASFILCVMVMVTVSALLPAEGAAGLVGSEDGHLLFQGATPLTKLHALRDGTLRIVSLEEVGPVISFPSLHCAVAYLVTAAFWPLTRLRWAVLLLNAVMAVSAVTHGAHYACDCVAGLLVAAVAFHAFGRLRPWSERILARMHDAAALAAAPAPIEHHPERWSPAFGKRWCKNKGRELRPGSDIQDEALVRMS